MIPNVMVDIRIDAAASLSGINATGNFVDPEITWFVPERCNIRLFQHNTTELSNLFFRFQTEEIPLGGRLMASRRGNETYFLHMFSPTTGSLGASQINKNIIFVLDKSGSMGGEKIVQLKDAFSNIISSLDPADLFNIIMFDSSIRPYSQELVPATESNRNDAVDYVKDIYAGGCTNLYDGMEMALAQLNSVSEGGMGMPIILMLTDGQANEGKYTASRDIITNIEKHNDQDVSIYCLGFGDDVDYTLLSTLAQENDGKSRKIYVGSDAVEQLWEFYSMISTPLLRDISFSYNGNAFDVYPEGADCLFDGSEIIIAGKLDTARNSVKATIEGEYSGGQFKTTSKFDLNEADDDIVPRFWAYKKTLALMDNIHVNGEEPDVVEMIVDLSLEFGFLTKYTGFFVDVGSFSEGTGDWGGGHGGNWDDPWDQQGGQGTDPNNPDTDGDGISDGQEGSMDNDGITGGGNGDTDGNGIPDNQEPGNPNADSDGDGLSNGDELARGTDPMNPDSDDDGFNDGWEIYNAADPLDPNSPIPAGDIDGDGLSNLDEWHNDTDPNDPDSDDDGMLDGAEVEMGCDPLNPDSDNDGLLDGEELLLGCNPLNHDTDNDGFTDRFEIENGSDPADPLSIPIPPDTDCDGLEDHREREYCTKTNDPDTDDDGFLDGIEVDMGYDPLDADSHPPYSDMDCNGIMDAYEPNNPNADSDGDGALNGQEWQYGTDPLDETSYPEPGDVNEEIDPEDINNYPSNDLCIDSDGDGFCDAFDIYRNDAMKWIKIEPIFDGDNDGVEDELDAFPCDPGEWADEDGDGYGDNCDVFPSDPLEWEDSDLDGYGDNGDVFPDYSMEWNDTDGDGYGDNSDLFPHDPDEWKDTDGDGYGDNRDEFPFNPDQWNDSDRDRYCDEVDAFPNDPSEWNDRDGDGYGDNSDAFPFNRKEWNDTDGDGYGDNRDAFPSDRNEWSDTDGDGYGDKVDEFPEDPAASTDTDGDGHPDRWNTGMGAGDSTSGLELDIYPEDPSRWRTLDLEEDTSAGDIETKSDDRKTSSGNSVSSVLLMVLFILFAGIFTVIVLILREIGKKKDDFDSMGRVEVRDIVPKRRYFSSSDYLKAPVPVGNSSMAGTRKLSSMDDWFKFRTDDRRRKKSI